MWFRSAETFIAHHHEWAAAALGVFTFLESVVLVGAFVPAGALMLVAGGLIAADVVHPAPIVAACVTGAILGDFASFALGRRYGVKALRQPCLARSRRQVARTRLLFRRYGVASLFLGRVMGPLRAFVPFIAGALRMRRRHFYVAAVSSAIPWALAMLAAGYLAAKGLLKAEAWREAGAAGLVLALVGALAVLAWVVWRLARAALARRPARTPVSAHRC